MRIPTYDQKVNVQTTKTGTAQATPGKVPEVLPAAYETGVGKALEVRQRS